MIQFLTMIAANDLRQGVIFEHNGATYQVLEFERFKKARAKGIVNIKARNVATNGVQELSFKSGDKVDDGSAVNVNLEFVYADKRREILIFSDPETKKRIELSETIVGESKRNFLVQGLIIQALASSDDLETAQIYDVTLPKTIEVEVTEAPPNDKGDTASGSTKPVTISSGAKISTPFFISAGDWIKVNTELGTYIERVNS